MLRKGGGGVGGPGGGPPVEAGRRGCRRDRVGVWPRVCVGESDGGCVAAGALRGGDAHRRPPPALPGPPGAPAAGRTGAATDRMAVRRRPGGDNC